MTDDNKDLPLPDFDHLPAESLASRIRSLDVEQLEQLIEYETDHAHRASALDLLAQRRDELRRGAEPTTGDPNAIRPETADPPGKGSAVGSGQRPDVNPPGPGSDATPPLGNLTDERPSR